ncbi:MAG: hypothetical protein H7Y33_14040 [Cytophagales bacterium]|nr:hypothetical protein [Rhizobacter sp.]
MTALPAVDMNLPGAGCLLCMAAASVANSSLSTHTKTLPYEDLPKLKNQVAQALGKKTKDVIVIEAPLDLTTLPDAMSKGPNLATKDFSSLQKKYGVDKLLVIEIKAVGMERTYSGYIPTGAPLSVLDGSGYLVNLSNNTYEWYKPVRVTRAADGKWDEPPKFPGLTNAYFQVLEMGKDEFLKPFTEK